MRAHRLLIPISALLAVLPMLVRGPSCGHDFDFHLLSWLEAASQFAHASYPHWAYTPAWNAGEPRFLFYPPLSWALGGLLGLLLPWAVVPAAFTFCALTLSGFTAHRLLRSYASPGAASLAAVVYLLNPYMLFTAYERTACGELLAAAWLPLLFAAALAPRVRVLAVAAPVGLLWLTNAPAAVMGCYALLLMLTVRLLHQRRGTLNAIARPAALGVLLGLGLAAFYLVPAIAERPQIQSEMAVISGMRIADNTLFHHMLPATDETAYHDEVVRTASAIACGVLLGIVLLGAITRRGLRATNLPLAPLLALLAAITLLLTPLSLPIWDHVPQLKFLQFPWRLTALLTPVLALTLALTGTRLLKRFSPAILAAQTLLLASVMILPCWTGFQESCSPADSIPARVALFHSPLGTESTDEYTPTDADADALHPHDPPSWLTDPANPNAPAPADAHPGGAPARLTLSLPRPELLILNRRQYPLWRVLLNGHQVSPHTPERDDGLLALDLPAGTSQIALVQAHSPDQLAGAGISLISVLILLLLKRVPHDRSSRRQDLSWG